MTLAPHTPVIQHLGHEHERRGRVVSTSGTNAVVRFEGGFTRVVPASTLTPVADLERTNWCDADNVTGT